MKQNGQSSVIRVCDQVPRCANNALSRMRRFAPVTERAVQIFAISIGAVFLLSGVVYLYLGRITLLWAGDLWDVYFYAWKHTWLQSALLKQDNHVKFFPRAICLANLRFFMATRKSCSLPAWAFLLQPWHCFLSRFGGIKPQA